MLLPHLRPIGILMIFIKDMGLGKTLSMLALVCSSLDLDSVAIDQDQRTEHRGTLIVAPLSS